jgi:23S rRNA (uridine2552-2'-O)-methyltransferase
MSKTATNSYSKPDFWAEKARKERYPARSVYKLEELAAKFKLFPQGKNSGAGKVNVLDLGAAPGSWSLFLLRKFASVIKLTSCDILPLSRNFDDGLFSGENFLFIQGDFTSAEIKKRIDDRGPFDVIVSDAAPSTTGNRLVDASRSLALAQAISEIADGCLAKKGKLVLKIFQGEDTAGFLKTLASKKPLASKAAASNYERVETCKPTASRNNSFETYIIAAGRG